MINNIAKNKEVCEDNMKTKLRDTHVEMQKQIQKYMRNIEIQ